MDSIPSWIGVGLVSDSGANEEEQRRMTSRACTGVAVFAFRRSRMPFIFCKRNLDLSLRTAKGSSQSISPTVSDGRNGPRQHHPDIPSFTFHHLFPDCNYQHHDVRHNTLRHTPSQYSTATSRRHWDDDDRPQAHASTEHKHDDNEYSRQHRDHYRVQG
ncbi:hypothetical protein BDZ89DRAFT_1033419 [Hymenopellis radicata]|nr:hypothetical protein BDZ89DRAFT_1033419 [Hymenopellis radicata]